MVSFINAFTLSDTKDTVMGIYYRPYFFKLLVNITVQSVIEKSTAV